MFAIEPPIEPMLAKLTEALPTGGGFLFEPKWDGFRAMVFRGGDEVYIQSRDLRPLDRYFPELHEACLRELPDGSVVDGEIVIATPRGLDFDALQLRLHPAASRVNKLAKETPASFVAFDLLVDATKVAGCCAASMAMRDAAGCSRSCKVSNGCLAMISSPSSTKRATGSAATASATSGK